MKKYQWYFSPLKWKNFPNSEVSWEHQDALWQFADYIQKFKEEGTARASRTKVEEDVTSRQTRGLRKVLELTSIYQVTRILLEV